MLNERGRFRALVPGRTGGRGITRRGLRLGKGAVGASNYDGRGRGFHIIAILCVRFPRPLPQYGPTPSAVPGSHWWCPWQRCRKPQRPSRSLRCCPFVLDLVAPLSATSWTLSSLAARHVTPSENLIGPLWAAVTWEGEYCSKITFEL